MENKPLICKGVMFLLILFVVISGVGAFDVVITPKSPDIIDSSFIPQIGSEISRLSTAYLGRTTNYTGSAVGAGDPETIKWKITIEGPEGSFLEPSMVDLDEVGWEDQTDLSTAVFHYPFEGGLSPNELVALGSCDETVNFTGHYDYCNAFIGFLLVENDTFTNADKIKFNFDAPIGNYTIRYELVDTINPDDDTDDIILSNAYEVSLTLDYEITISNSGDFTIGETNFSPALGNSLFRNSVAYYSVNSVSSIDEIIPYVQWKITIVGSEGSVLEPSMVDLDEVGRKDQNGNNTQTFHYPLVYGSPNELVAFGSCDTPDDHDDGCATNFFDVNPNDNFTNIDSINFSISAPKGNYTITRQLVDEYENALSDEFVVAEVTIPGESEVISGAGNETITTNLGLNIFLDDLNGIATADLNIIRYDETEIGEDNLLPTSLFGVLGNFYEINSPGLANGDFSVTLTFNYPDTNQNGIVDGTDMPETSLEVMFFNATSDSWEAMNGEVIDADANTVSISTDHFTLFSIVSTFAPSGEAPATSGSGDNYQFGGIIRTALNEEGRETPSVQTQDTETTPVGSDRITGAIIGALGSPEGIVALVLVVLGVAVIAFVAKAGNSAEKRQKKKK